MPKTPHSPLPTPSPRDAAPAAPAPRRAQGRLSVFLALVYMTLSTYMIFIPLYLGGLGYDRTTVALLLAAGPFAALAAQPAWGLAADRARSKNAVFAVILAGAAGTILLFPVSPALAVLFPVIVAFSAFHSTLVPMSDAIALELSAEGGHSFGPVRLMGTLGYAVMAVVAGAVASRRLDAIFPLYAVFAVLSLVAVLALPRVRGHQHAGLRVPLRRLFDDRGYVLLLALNFGLQFTLGYYYSFFSLFLKDLGGSTQLQGWAICITSLAEVPFLLFADRILARIGVRAAILASGLLLSLRWLLFFVSTGPAMLLAVNALHGVTVIVMLYGVAVYVNGNLPKELRASGQTMNAMLCIGAARILGNLFGGWLSDRWGLRAVFLLEAGIAFAAVAVFGTLFLVLKRRSAAGAPAGADASPDAADAG